MIRTTVFLPQDPLSQRIGGILTFVKGFIKFAPDDFETEVVGTTRENGPCGAGRRLRSKGERPRFSRSLPIVRPMAGRPFRSRCDTPSRPLHIER